MTRCLFKLLRNKVNRERNSCRKVYYQNKVHDLKKIKPHKSWQEINNGNCTEWSAIWCEIKRVITKLHKFDFTPKLHDTKCNFHFIIFILKSETLFVNLEEPDAFLFKNVHTFASSFTSRSLATVGKKICDSIGLIRVKNSKNVNIMKGFIEIKEQHK